MFGISYGKRRKKVSKGRTSTILEREEFNRITNLIMKPRLRQALPDRLVLIKHMPQILHRRRNNATAPRGANDIVQRAIVNILDNSRRDGRQRPFPRLNKICRRRRVAESVRLTRDGEVVHLVVHDDAGFRDDEPAAEEEVDRRGERDGHAGGVGRDDVGGTVAGWRLEMRLLDTGCGCAGDLRLERFQPGRVV